MLVYLYAEIEAVVFSWQFKLPQLHKQTKIKSVKSKSEYWNVGKAVPPVSYTVDRLYSDQQMTLTVVC